MQRYRYKSTYKPRSLRRLEKKSQRNIILTLIIAFALLYFALSWGLPALVGGLSLFNKYKPTVKIDTSNQDSAIAPPVLNIPFEATSSASIKISGYSMPNSKVEIYFDDALKTTTQTHDNGGFSTDPIPLSLGTNNIYGQTLNDQSKKSLPSKTIKIIYSNEKPKLELTEPSNGLQIKGGDKKVKVSGKTDPSNSVSINGVTIIVNSDGNFSKEIVINEGENTITVSAINSVGNSAQLEVKVNYAPS